MNAALRILARVRKQDISEYATGRRLCWRLFDACGRHTKETENAIRDLRWAVQCIACAVHEVTNTSKDLQRVLYSPELDWTADELRQYRELILDALEEDFKDWAYAPS